MSFREPLLRLLLLLFALTIASSAILISAQENFKGERAPNPIVNRRSTETTKPRIGGTSRSKRKSGSSQGSSTLSVSDRIEDAIDRGNSARDALSFAEAEKQYRSAISLNRSEWRAWYGLGNVFNDTSSYGEAVEALQEATTLNPNSAEAHHSLGTSYFFEKEYDKAVEQYRQSVGLNPSNAFARFDLGMTYVKLKNRSAAMEQYEALKDLNSNLGSYLLGQIKKYT